MRLSLEQPVRKGLQAIPSLPSLTVIDRLGRTPFVQAIQGRAPTVGRWSLLLIVLIVAAIFTGLNMFDFPHYESDEGTYMASA